MGSQALAPGDYNVVVSCPTYLRALDARGWTVTHQDNGNITGTITLVRHPHALGNIKHPSTRFQGSKAMFRLFEMIDTFQAPA